MNKGLSFRLKLHFPKQWKPVSLPLISFATKTYEPAFTDWVLGYKAEMMTND